MQQNKKSLNVEMNLCVIERTYITAFNMNLLTEISSGTPRCVDTPNSKSQ